MVNVYNSYMQLAGGEFSPSSVSATAALGAAHPAVTGGTPITSPAGWSFTTLTSSAASDAYNNYVFQPSPGVSGYTFTATMVWERQYNSNTSTVEPINNLDLYLYDTTTGSIVDWSNSAVDNVQDVYDKNLTAGDTYVLESLKLGGAVGTALGDVVSNTETYALAFNFAPVQQLWSAGSGGTWGMASNWTGSVIPQSATATATFNNSISARATINLNGHWTVGNVNFNSSYSYTIAPGTGGILTLDNATRPAYVTAAAGNDAITAPLVLNSNAVLTVNNLANTLSISGAISGAGGVTVAGNGALSLSGLNSYQGASAVNSGSLLIAAAGALPSGTALSIGTPTSTGFVQLAPGTGVASVSSLTINPGSTMDLTMNNSLVINYPPGNDPYTTVRGYLRSAYNGGLWTDTGLTSSSVQAEVAKALTSGGGVWSIGYADGSRDIKQTIAVGNQLVVEPALVGDARLTGSVSFLDVGILAQHLGWTNADWAEGDFNYDGTVNFLDLGLLAQNLSQSALLTPLGDDVSASFAAQWKLAVAEVQGESIPTNLPEPGMIGLLAVGAAGLLARRRRT
jgi:autotransporter-associated beta strand protein